MSSYSAYPSPYARQGMMSPASSPSAAGAGAAQRVAPLSPTDAFHGQYPGAPHLRPIALPETGSPGYGSGPTRSRPVSLPPAANGTGLGIYGMEPAAASASPGEPAVHPLLRATPAGCALRYNILHPHAARHAGGAQLAPGDLRAPATHPPAHALRVTLLCYGGAHALRGAPQRVPWAATLAPPRRASAPAPGQPAPPLALGDALAALHGALLVPVTEGELCQFSPEQLRAAHAVRAARRAAAPGSPAGLVRADFLHGCTELAGFVRNPDNSFTVRMAPPSAF